MTARPNVTVGKEARRIALKLDEKPKVAAKTVKKFEAQEKVLALLAQGFTVDDAMAHVGRTRVLFYSWGTNDPDFAQRADRVRNRVPDTAPAPFVDFRKTYFGYDTFPHQEKIIKAIEGAAPRSITMILLPPGAGKTTVLEDYICYKLGPVDPDHRICVISETRDHARKVLRRVANRMVDRGQNKAFIDRFGPFKAPDRETNKPWSADAISIITGQHDERDYSCEVRSAGSAIYGARYDLIILDDVQSIRSLNSTDKLMEYFRQDVYTRMPPDMSRGQIVIIGTRVGPDDFYERLLTEDLVDALVMIPALDEEGQSYWPKTTAPTGETVGFDVDDLAKIEKMVGDITWNRVYMQRPISKHGQTFTEDMVDKSLNYERGIDPKAGPFGMFRLASLDPAIAGHAVFRIADVSHDKLWLLDSRNKVDLARYEAIWDIVEELSAIWKPNVWIIEGNAIQAGILRSDRMEELSKKYGFRITAHQTGKNKTDDVLGVASMAGSFLRGEIDMPYGTPEARTSTDRLAVELKKWRSDIPTRQLRQDEVMALWFLHLEWQRMKSQLASRIDRRLETRGLPWRGTRYGYAGASR